MHDVINFLKEQSESLIDTARRCTDPAIAAEVVSVAEILYSKADDLKEPIQA